MANNPYLNLPMHIRPPHPDAPVDAVGQPAHDAWNLANDHVGSPTINFDTKPNYQGDIANESGYLRASGDVQRANLAAAGNRGASVRELLAHYGDVPDFAKMFGGGLDFINSDVNNVTKDLAAKNTAAGTSTLGQLAHTHDTNLANLRALMASRGILDSGQSALTQSEEGRQYAGNVDNAQSTLFQALQAAQKDYLNTYTTGQQTLAGAASSAADRLAQTSVGDPTHVQATQDSGFSYNGGSVFKDANGNYWTAAGAPVAKGDLNPAGSSTPTPPPASSSSAGSIPTSGHLGIE